MARRTYEYQVDSLCVFVEKIEMERLCVANASITHFQPPSAGLVADVRPSLSETGGTVPTTAL